MVEFIKFDKKNPDDEGEKKSIRRVRPKKFFSLKKLFLVFLIFFIITSIISSITYSLTPKVAVIPIKGPIMTEKQVSIYGSSISSREIANTIEELGKDDSVKAILLDINSPGGSPVASDEIARAIKKARENKKVYALINDIGASGAFWIAVAADKIYASEMSTIGSIGVTSVTFGLENLIKDYNITYRKQTAGLYKDIGSPFREPLEEENKIIQDLLDEIHSKFIQHVADSRNLDYEFVKEYATGEIFLGSTSKEIGFIDEIGYYPDVIAELKKISGENSVIVNYGDVPSLLEVIGVETMFKDLFKVNSKNQIMLE